MVPQNIKINKVRSFDAKLRYDKYLDYMLYRGEVYGASTSDECLATFIDFSNPECYTAEGGVQSLSSWTGSVNTGVELTHIGMTGVDNGLISYPKDGISNRLFYQLFFNSKLTIDESDTKFHMTPVDGNTKQHCYDIEIGEEDGKHFLAFKGGFLQGFYKLEGFDYQVLPDYIENDWHTEFVIRPRSDYKDCETSLNHSYPENSGYFFYMGTRAENKFAEIMNRTSAYTYNYVPEFLGPELKNLIYYHYEFPDFVSDKDVDILRNQKRIEEENDPNDKETYLDNGDNYYSYDDPDIYDENDIDIFMSDAAEKLEEYLNNDEDMSLSGITLSARTGYFEINTDNKFLFFNRTCTGFTVPTWEEAMAESVVLTGYTKRDYKTNAFLLFNRTCTGLTVDKVDEYFDNVWDESDDYNIQKDTIGNAFGLKYNSDGSISYSYTMRDCDAESGYSQQVETTKPGLIKDGEWNVVNVRFTILNNSYRTCIKKDEDGNMVQTQVPNNVGKRKMKIMIYVNGHLVLISKELNEFNFRALKDIADRQEGVPFNISLGGGTQGLGERVWPDYYQPIYRHYYLEQTYGGSFIGDMRSFKMYDCKLNYPTIKNNYKNEIN